MISSLRALGILGINRRNFDYIQCWNPRSSFPAVDDKILTKELAEAAGVPTPRTIAIIEAPHELRHLPRILEPEDAFVVKPARGAQGNGILVASERSGDGWRKPSGARVDVDDVHYRVSEILSGLFSLGGQPDRALIEQCLRLHPALEEISHGGIPDMRVILYRGLAVMAMLRLPTRSSDGRANLHQGAVGVGVDLRTGRTTRAVMESRSIDRHPDTGAPLVGIELPDMDEVLGRATRMGAVTKLGYIGVDLVHDERRGPVVLELNARPGLSIQLANGRGLMGVLEPVEALDEIPDEPAERVRLARRLAREVTS